MEHALKAYRLRTGTSLDVLAAKAQASKATLSRIENGKQSPSLDLIGRIRDATDGALTANDFMPATPPKQSAEASA